MTTDREREMAEAIAKAERDEESEEHRPYVHNDVMWCNVHTRLEHLRTHAPAEGQGEGHAD